MKLVLLKDDKRYGKRGAVINAADGFANNYLIPMGIAAPATNSNLNVAAGLNASEQHRLATELSAAKELASKIAAVVVNLTIKVGEGGKVFGSVTGKEIASGLAALGIDVDKKKIELSNPIKAIGQYSVKIKLHKDVNCTLTVNVAAI